jgi:hypothetical protein
MWEPRGAIRLCNDAAERRTSVAILLGRLPADRTLAWSVASVPGRGGLALLPLPERYELRVRYRAGASTVSTRALGWPAGGSVIARVTSRLDPAGRLCLQLRGWPGCRPRCAVVEAVSCLAPEACAVVSARGLPAVPPAPLIAGAQLWLDTAPPTLAAVLARPIAPGTVLRLADVRAWLPVSPGEAVRLSGSSAGYSLRLSPL